MTNIAFTIKRSRYLLSLSSTKASYCANILYVQWMWYVWIFLIPGKEETFGSHWHIHSRTNWSRCTSNLHHGAEEDSWWRCYSYIWLVSFKYQHFSGFCVSWELAESNLFLLRAVSFCINLSYCPWGVWRTCIQPYSHARFLCQEVLNSVPLVSSSLSLEPCHNFVVILRTESRRLPIEYAYSMYRTSYQCTLFPVVMVMYFAVCIVQWVWSVW